MNERELDDRSFDAIREIAYREAGLKLADAKRALVASRLAKRLDRLGCRDYGEYVRRLRAGGAELREFINRLTTNKTDFFREPHHFAFLRDRVAREAAARAAAGGRRRLRVWSAGCSTGEEPYTIAMVLREALGPAAGWDVKILASDIDTEVLAKAEAGSFGEDRAAALPPELRAQYFERRAGRLWARAELRDLIAFRRVNLIDEPWPFRSRFDAIFCRNVTIYFDRPTQDRLYRRFAAHLEPHGYFFAGHSENLSWLPDVFAPAGQTVHRLAPRPGAPSRARLPCAAPAVERASARFAVERASAHFAVERASARFAVERASARFAAERPTPATPPSVDRVAAADAADHPPVVDPADQPPAVTPAAARAAPAATAGRTLPAPAGRSMPAAPRVAPAGRNVILPVGLTLPAPAGLTLPAPAGLTLPAPSGRSMPAPAGRSLPAPPGRSMPAPAGRSLPAPPGRSMPAPAGRSLPAPSGRSLPAPSGRSLPAPSGRSLPAPAGRSMPAARAVSAPPAAPPPRDGEPHSSRGPSAVSIQSGGVYAAAGPGLVRTVLGSCVAACLWDPTAGVGGMNHFMLPGGNDDEMPARFGVHAMELLVNELMRLGADRRSLRAKAFGGARVLASTSRPGVAEANAAFVQEFLAREGIPLVASKFGGERPYEVRFEPCTGRAFVRQLARSGDAVERAEQHYLARLREQARRPEPGATVLF